MTLENFGAPNHFTRRTISDNKPIEDVTGVVYVDEIPTIESESIIPTFVEEKNP